MTFTADAVGEAVSIAFKNGGANTGTFTCLPVAADTFISACTATGLAYAEDATSVAITVT